jgi:hypothetical protein
MPPGQDDNPFGTPRGAWGRQPPTTFGLSTPVKRAPRPSNQIRVPTPSLTPRNILTGGLVSQPRPAPAPPPPPAPTIAPEPTPEPASRPAAEPDDAPLTTGSVLARASAAPKARAGGLPFPPVAGIGVVIAAIVVAGLLLFRRDPPAPEPAIVAAPETPAPAQPTPAEPAPTALAGPVAAPPVAAASPAPPVRRPPTAPSPRRPAVEAEPPAAITPPPLAAPPIAVAPPPPAPAAALPLPTDPEVPMVTRLPQ